MQEKFYQLFSQKTPEMYYILGLIFGDGCVHFNESKRKYYVNLTSGDLDILINFQNFIGKQYKIKKYKTANAYYINVWSKPLTEALFKLYKLRNKKSNCLIFPKMEEQYKKFFILGLFVTDGCNRAAIIKTKRKEKTYIYKNLEWSYTSCSKEFIEIVNKVISTTLNISPAKINSRKHDKGNDSYCIKYTGKNGMKVCNWLYDCPEYMICKRKYKMFKDHF